MTTTPYACHNHDPYTQEVIVQDGWLDHRDPQGVLIARTPRMKTVPFRMEPGCMYVPPCPTAGDPRCAGCRWEQSQQSEQQSPDALAA